MHKSLFAFFAGISLLLSGWYLNLETNSTQAARLHPAIQTTPTRPSPPPLETPTTIPTDTPPPVSQPQGALIWLHLEFASAPEFSQWQNVWTIVQWQDAADNWHDVTGWRGPLDEIYTGHGRKVWWLSENLLGTGPFRWVVYPDPERNKLVESINFSLPQKSGEITKVTVMLP